jgi:hypothetical protein
MLLDEPNETNKITTILLLAHSQPQTPVAILLANKYFSQRLFLRLLSVDHTLSSLEHVVHVVEYVIEHLCAIDVSEESFLFLRV